ncbi:hypothetical protein N9D31_00395 [Oligoflexaceae bacterium]|nr:hypothetical protein [Oligoflexaceae bacterium]
MKPYIKKWLTVTPAIAGAGLMLCAAFGGRASAHRGTPNLGAEKACAEQSLGKNCEWTDSHDAKYMGTCRQIADTLRCVRNRPIVYPEASSGDRHHHGAAHTHKRNESEANRVNSKVKDSASIPSPNARLSHSAGKPKKKMTKYTKK